MAGLPRTVVKWIQGLDLTYPIKNPKWDLSNGFLVAEIFSWYYPDEIKMFSFNNGQSLDSKMTNWSLLKKFIIKNQLNISVDLIDATLHCKESAAILLIENIYQVLTNRTIQKPTPDYEIDLTDWAYQQQLPFHARSTASKSIKNNIRNTELNTDPNLKLSASKVERIISSHVDHRKLERELEPNRFNVKKTIAEKCIQRPVPEARKNSEYSSYDDVETETKPITLESNVLNSKTFILDNIKTDKSYKEIRVKQDVYNMSLASVN